MQEFIGKLAQRLNQPLPGLAAHERMRPKAVSRFRLKHATEPRKGAVMILLYDADNEAMAFPLIQRPVYQGVHSGQMGLPGGRAEQGDGDLIFTALRETYEEIGVNPGDVQVVGVLSEFFVAASNHLILPVVGYMHKPPYFKPDSYEVEEVVVASVNDLLGDSGVKETEIKTGAGYVLQAPYYDVQGKVVWGATAMILSEFIQIINEL